MASDLSKKVQDKKKEGEAMNFGMADLLRLASLGVLPQAPRLPMQAMHGGGMFGGYPKNFGGKSGIRGSLGFETLRQVAERSPLLSTIVSKRAFQCTRYARQADQTKKGDVGFKVVHRRHTDKDFTVPEGFKKKCQEVEDSLLKPWTMYWDDGLVFRQVEKSLAGFMSKIMIDHLVINRPCIELGLDQNRVPRAFGAIDGANVIPTFNALKFLSWKDPQSATTGWEKDYKKQRTLMQQISDKYKIDVDERTEYIYLVSGIPYATYRHDELIVAPFMPETDVRTSGYPKSLTERAVFIILAEIMAMQANSRYFESGSMSEVLIAMKGQYQDQHIKETTDILQANMSGVQGMFRVPLIAMPGGAQDLDVIPIKQNHRDMLFDIYIQKLTNLACATFSMHPSEINEAPRAGDNTGALNQASQNVQIGMAQEQGLFSSLLHFKTEIFDEIVQRIDPDMRFEWDTGENEATQLDIVAKYATITTVNERRAMMGLDEISEEEGGSVIDNQFISQQKQAQQQQEMQEQQGQEGQDGDQSGSGPFGNKKQPDDDQEGESGVPNSGDNFVRTPKGRMVLQ